MHQMAASWSFDREWWLTSSDRAEMQVGPWIHGRILMISIPVIQSWGGRLHRSPFRIYAGNKQFSFGVRVSVIPDSPREFSFEAREWKKHVACFACRLEQVVVFKSLFFHLVPVRVRITPFETRMLAASPMHASATGPIDSKAHRFTKNGSRHWERSWLNPRGEIITYGIIHFCRWRLSNS